MNRVEREIEIFKERRSIEEEDVFLWWNGKDKYREKFLTSETWQVVREKHQVCDWYKAIWFKHATPKFSFFCWVAMRDRLTTGNRMAQWGINIDTSCIFCKYPMESVDHLFFECPFSEQIWRSLAKGVLRDKYTQSWAVIKRIITDESQEKLPLFTVRYLFQATAYNIWRERNRRRHKEAASPPVLLEKLIDKTMRPVPRLRPVPCAG